MAVTPDFVREIFKGLEEGDEAAFFTHVADDVDWTVMGTHPLAGRYRSKADFIAGAFTKMGKVLPQGTQLHLDISSSKAAKRWSSSIPWRLHGTP